MQILLNEPKILVLNGNVVYVHFIDPSQGDRFGTAHDQGIEDMGFLGVLKKQQKDFPGVNYKQHGIFMGDEKISRVLEFRS